MGPRGHVCTDGSAASFEDAKAQFSDIRARPRSRNTWVRARPACQYPDRNTSELES
jgi:hypothetical protein